MISINGSEVNGKFKKDRFYVYNGKSFRELIEGEVINGEAILRGSTIRLLRKRKYMSMTTPLEYGIAESTRTPSLYRLIVNDLLEKANGDKYFRVDYRYEYSIVRDYSLDVYKRSQCISVIDVESTIRKWKTKPLLFVDDKLRFIEYANTTAFILDIGLVRIGDETYYIE